MNRKWKVILSVLILSFIFPLGALGDSRYFTVYLPLEFGLTTTMSKTTTDSLDIEQSSTSQDSISSESTEVTIKATKRSIETVSSSLEVTIMDQKEQTDVELQQEGEQ
ncbi:hypothetical protein A5821_000120 [Enterococcus sp. 7F3_DIV0205]|uniref:Uncharacterized protein n=1 Tax=Candidatus Enterococcus palustris TaxID=1834189 RepID=A0AAQ3Y3P7_9ENTE|nr:hypothetical protein [Enterococcus sp. 7F3_DIV0205]OTN84526.1 hypothetical protein A5821_000454 [Enterococcus sp. 7F3_DIV0205]